jgi:hypothetical protein
VAGRNPSEAVNAFVKPIQSALGQFASGKVTADVYKPGREGVLAFNNEEVVKLSGSANIGLSVCMRYCITSIENAERGPWKVSTTAYMYALHIDDVELYAYHWHPFARSQEVRPHLHHPPAGKHHIPTGRVMIEDVLNLAIQLGATPSDMTRWEQLDKANREKFARGATWGVGPA